MLSIPPLLPSIHRDLRLSETAVGALTSIPVLLLSLGAVFGSLLVARLGARRALLLGLALITLAGASRGIGGSSLLLFAMTVLMGAGIAISQPTLPSLVRHWLPDRSGVATAVYSNGLLVGEIVAASLTAPILLALLGHRWPLALAFWSVVVLAIAVTILLSTAHEPRDADAPPVRWWPDWRSAFTWRLGIVLGCASLEYFGGNAFIPDYLRVTHHGSLISPALTILNLSQLGSSILVAVLPSRLIARRWPIAVSGLLAAASALGFLMGGVWVVAWAALLGFSTALVLVLALALPPIISAPHDVHRLTAAMFTICYACSFLGSILAGVIWDATRVPAAAFAPVGISGVLMTVLVLGLNLGAYTTKPASA